MIRNTTVTTLLELVTNVLNVLQIQEEDADWCEVGCEFYDT
jgi:hypothetical protein